MLPRITRVVAGLAMTLVVVQPVPTHADEGVGLPTLDEATFLQRVLARSPRSEVFADRKRAARAAVTVAAVVPNPTLSYEREAVPGIDAHDDFVRLEWPVDLAGRRRLAVAGARANADAERLTVDREAWLLEIEARQAYLDAVHARESVARLDAARTSLATMVDALRSRATQGDASSYDADRAALELDALDDERATALRSLAIARLRLGGLVGEPATAYEPSDRLVIPPRPSETSRGAHRPDVDAARARALHADRELTIAQRSWFPRLQVMVGMMSSGSSSGDGLGYVVGIGGELPLLNRGGAAAERSRADARRWRSEATALAAEASAESEQARRELVLRIAQAEAYAAGPAKRADDLQRRASVAYREGDRPILELLDVERGARHAAVRAIELIYEARRAELVLRRAIGRNP
ncbi:MAG: czcC [Myxococcales bacterium]|nr:czcC [Myxococcales bacterium]